MKIDLTSLEQQHGLPSGILSAVMKTESNGNPNAVSPRGAQGLFQFMPETAKQYGIDPLNPEQAAQGAAKMLSDLHGKYKGDLPKVLAAYNWGQGNVDRKGIDNLPIETQGYIKKVSANMPNSIDTSQVQWDDAPAIDTSKVQWDDAKPHDLKLDQPKNKSAAPSTVDSVLRGMKDPIDGGAQLLTHMLPNGVVNAGNKLNNWIADKTGLVTKLPDGGVDELINQEEDAYQARRKAGGETGVDWARIGGNVISPANLAIGSKLPAMTTTAGKVVTGIGGGALSSMLNPVVGHGDYVDEKAKQIGIGAISGGIVPAVTGGISRVISPNASKNVNLKLIRESGINPTVGQALGGRWNSLEEKATSIPIVGDMISSARGDALKQFNNAAINRATGNIGATVEGEGQQAIKQAGDALSSAYDDALGGIKAVKFDDKFNQDLGQLHGMAQNLVPSMRNRFNKVVSDIFEGRTSPNGTMLADTFKNVDSELGQLASKYSKSSVASESELGDALLQLQSIIKQQAMRSNPVAGQALKNADRGWANLVILENAAKNAKNNEGLFTPAQLNSAIQSADKSVRGRAVARGTALMQDLGNAGQQVLGNKVPNSFTTDRALIAGGGLLSPLVDPTGVLLPSILTGAAAYTSPVQKALVKLISERPEFADSITKAIEKISPRFIPGAAQVGTDLLE